MRTLSTILIIVLLLIGGSFTSYRQIQNTTRLMRNHLEAVEQSVSTQKWEASESELSSAQQSWTKTKTWLSILLDHQEIDTIDLTMKRLGKYLETKDVTLSLGEVSALKFLFEHISDAELFTLENII